MTRDELIDALQQGRDADVRIRCRIFDGVPVRVRYEGGVIVIEAEET